MTDKQRYETNLCLLISEESIDTLPCYPDEAERIFKVAWEVQQKEIDRLRNRLQEIEDGQQVLFEEAQ